jgi:hypothetical protein
MMLYLVHHFIQGATLTRKPQKRKTPEATSYLGFKNLMAVREVSEAAFLGQLSAEAV